MSGREIESRAALHIPRLEPGERERLELAAAVRVANRVARETAGTSAADPAVHAKVLVLLDALGIPADQIRLSRRRSLAAALVDAMRRRWIRQAAPHIAGLERQLAEKQHLNARLKGAAS